MVAILAAVVTEDPDPPDRAGPLWPLIKSLLRRDPAARPDPQTVAYTLYEISNGSDPTLGLPGDPEPPADDSDSAEEAARPASGDPSGTGEPASGSAGRPPQGSGGEPIESASVTGGPLRRGTGGEPTESASGGVGRQRPVPGDTGPSVPGETTAMVAGRSRRGRGRLVAVAVAGLVVLGAVGWWSLAGGHTSSSANGGSPAASPKVSSPARGGGASSSGNSPSPSPSASPSATSSTALPKGFHRYHDRTKFSIGVPDGWTVSHRGHYLYVEDPKSSRLLIVDQTDTPKADPLKDWRQQESNRTGSYPGYHRVRLEKVDYPQAEKAADWEFTYDGDHGRTHILNRNVLANSKHAYALYWSAPQSEWASSRDIFDGFAASFRPADS